MRAVLWGGPLDGTVVEVAPWLERIRLADGWPQGPLGDLSPTLEYLRDTVVPDRFVYRKE